jgi:hypothetical protein
MTGRKLILDFIMKSIRQSIPVDDVNEIWSIGSIKYSPVQVKVILESLRNDEIYPFSFPKTFAPQGDYVDFYQASSKEGRHFILAVLDRYDVLADLEPLFLVEIRKPYPTTELPRKNEYFRARIQAGSQSIKS